MSIRHENFKAPAWAKFAPNHIFNTIFSRRYLGTYATVDLVFYTLKIAYSREQFLRISFI